MNTESRDALFRLLEALCDERLDDAGTAQLERLVVGDPEARRLYVEYLSLHGLLHWDAAPESESIDIDSILRQGAPSVAPPRRRTRLVRTAVSAAAALLVMAAAFFASRHQPQPGVPGNGGLAKQDQAPTAEPVAPLPKIDLHSMRPERNTNPDAPAETLAQSPTTPSRTVEDGEIVATIDRLLAQSWKSSELTPSPRASDEEWLRRVSLDLCGRIPELSELERFAADRSPNKRLAAIDRLLNDPAFARHFSTIWTNLLVGRTPRRKIDRDGLAKFLREQFWNDRPWSETVTELVAAEGSAADNGAANYLLAHLNNQAVPATAITARVFLCQQVQCAQCHIHPVVKDWGQEQFWQLNAFFQGTKLVEKSRQLDDGRRVTTRELVSHPVSGPIYFETLGGVMRVAYPSFDGQEISSDKSTDRRRELARLISSGDRPQLAAAFVNRLWAQMFGYGFTNPLDDMGPHHPPTHPEVLDALTREFVRSDYSVRHLLRVMCSTELYQLSSRAVAGNAADDPQTGSPPMFTRMYVKPLSAEQVFDSLLVATSADHTAASGQTADRRRQDWLDQFYSALENDENAEQTTFDGSLPQALVMMNGDLVKEAVSGRPGTFLHKVATSQASDQEKLSQLSMAIVGRQPTSLEQRVFEESLKPAPRAPVRMAAAASPSDSLQDACWAYLNSTEFVVNR